MRIISYPAFNKLFIFRIFGVVIENGAGGMSTFSLAFINPSILFPHPPSNHIFGLQWGRRISLFKLEDEESIKTLQRIFTNIIYFYLLIAS